MDKATLEALGITREGIEKLVVDRIVQELLDGQMVTAERFVEQISSLVRQRADEAVAQLASEHVLPRVESYVKGLVLQETSKWGEAIGKPVSLVEYLVHRAEQYMMEPVDSQGRSEHECKSRGDTWYRVKDQSRITYMVNEHLSHDIGKAMQQALSNAHNTIANGIAETARLKLLELAETFKVTVMPGKKKS